MSSSPPESPTIATANTSSPTADKPPTKPRTRSNYHLESNPFEVSFSQPEPTPRGRPPSRDATSEAKPKLPPITAMASPSAAGDFTWAFGHGGSADVNSLRSGPLSPAMLAGPQYASHANHGQNGTHHGVTNGGGAGFDVMRTGLTPDVSRTGLTPLIGGPASFPPPSPNTAAFIAMVTNQNNPNGVAGGIASAAGVAPPATITPGTFSAITGAILNGQNGAGGDSAAAGSSPTASHHAHPLSVSHGPHDADDAAHTAANGLFLLSQAHHELTKREEQQPVSQPQIRAPPSQAARAGGAKGGGRSSNNTNSAPAPTTAAGKRKNTSESVAPAAKRARATAARASNSRANAGSRRKKSEEMMSSNEDDEDEEDEMDGEGLSDDEELQAAARVGTVSSKSGGGSKKPETEEEKRKNFLERNRQGLCHFFPESFRSPSLATITMLTSASSSSPASSMLHVSLPAELSVP
ncbi:hypothetical protein DL93DRAFT_1731745 [Clavulina sp. PMI_390]|nr:hypothetical protein DL93DRAFT_1731745 [Clavulina sp. PMI_390]